MSFRPVGTVSLTGIEVTGDNAGYGEIRPMTIEKGNRYLVTAQSSASGITATLGANSTLFSFRWAVQGWMAIIRKFGVQAHSISTITSGVRFDLVAYKAHNFTANYTGGNSVAPATKLWSQRMRSDTMGPTQLVSANVGQLTVCSTAGLGGGTVTLDATPLARVMGFTGTTAPTKFYTSNDIVYLVDSTRPGRAPLTLQLNEGVVIQNPLAGPATGTFGVTFYLEWLEVPIIGTGFYPTGS